jgi:hypothetical protein
MSILHDGHRPPAAPARTRRHGPCTTPIGSVEEGIMLGTLLLIVLILALLGSVPAWPYSRGWGYYPSGGIGLLLIVLIILLATGRI